MSSSVHALRVLYTTTVATAWIRTFPHALRARRGTWRSVGVGDLKTSASRGSESALSCLSEDPGGEPDVGGCEARSRGNFFPLSSNPNDVKVGDAKYADYADTSSKTMHADTSGNDAKVGDAKYADFAVGN